MEREGKRGRMETNITVIGSMTKCKAPANFRTLTVTNTMENSLIISLMAKVRFKDRTVKFIWVSGVTVSPMVWEFKSYKMVLITKVHLKMG